MKRLHLGIAAVLAVSITACGSNQPVSRSAANTQYEILPITQQLTSPYSVADVRVTVPETLKVDESNKIFPIADIVWRGDPFGDRYKQIEAIFEEGMTRGAANLHGGRLVNVDIVVMRFHAMTERARFSIGGVHSITFTLTIRDAKTNEMIEAPRIVVADLNGFGGKRAIEAEHLGQTQKVRIIDHLANVIQNELSLPVPQMADAS